MVQAERKAEGLSFLVRGRTSVGTHLERGPSVGDGVLDKSAALQNSLSGCSYLLMGGIQPFCGPVPSARLRACVHVCRKSHPCGSVGSPGRPDVFALVWAVAAQDGRRRRVALRLLSLGHRAGFKRPFPTAYSSKCLRGSRASFNPGR